MSAVAIPLEEQKLSLRAEAANRCRERISNALRGASVAFYDMSMGLLETYENEYAREWGYENFTDYVESELDMKYRSAYYMVEIGRSIRSLGINRDRVERIGWTKLKEISGVLMDNPEQSEKYLDMAENMSTSQLKEALRSEVHMTDRVEARQAIMRMSLKFEGDSAGILSDGLAMAYGDLGKEDVNLALSHIVGEWLLARGGAPQATTLDDWIRYLQNAYGVKLIKADNEDAIDSMLTGENDQSIDLDEDAALEELLR